jgi:hypothetical protein
VLGGAAEVNWKYIVSQVSTTTIELVALAKVDVAKWITGNLSNERNYTK